MIAIALAYYGGTAVPVKEVSESVAAHSTDVELFVREPKSQRLGFS